MRKSLIAILLALVLAVVPAAGVFAQSSDDVTVTADPLYLSITNTNDDSTDTWLINGLGTGTESGQININTTYYANPITDGDDTTPPSDTVLGTECYFTVTNAAGADTCDLTVTWGAFTTGHATMTNSDAGTNGADLYGAYCWYEGMTTYSTSKVIVKSSNSDKMYTTGLAAEASLKWGVEILTRTNAWAGGTSSTSTLTITATAD